MFEMGTGGSSPLLSPDVSLVFFPICCVTARSIRCSRTFVRSASFSLAFLASGKKSFAILDVFPFFGFAPSKLNNVFFFSLA